jgi:SAM-dependent methyltransferase
MNYLQRALFDLWYFSRPPWDSGVPPPELLAYLETHPAGRALDIGCGTGTNVIAMARHGWRASGFDFSARAIHLARRKARAAGAPADFHIDDASTMKTIEGRFDLALDIGCFHIVPTKEKYLSSLTRILAPGGSWLLYGFIQAGNACGGPGLIPSDLDLIQSHGLSLIHRKDGIDGRDRPSAWFNFQAPRPRR